MSHLLVEDLRSQIVAGQALVIVGAGVSVAATGGARTASWLGLIRDGIARCETVVASSLPSGWGDRLRAQIDSGDVEELLSAAENVTRRLGGPGGGEYRRWLRESVGSLTATDVEVIEAIAGLGVPIATTNYDSLIEDVTDLSTVTWRQGAQVERIIRRDDLGIIHLHGHWQDPASVVLGIRSYQDVLDDEHAQEVQRALGMLQSLVFIGFGAGLGDPNFGALRVWLRRVMAGSEYRHFRLSRDDELSRLRKEHDLAERIMVLGYGPQYTDLGPFLRALAPPRTSPATPKVDRNSGIVSSGPKGVAQVTDVPMSRNLISISAAYSRADVAQTIAALHQLPPDIVDFTGRRQEINEATLALKAKAEESQGPRLLAISGKPGIGKSALAIHVAHLLSSDAVDGQFYFNFRGADELPLDPFTALGQFLRAVGIPGELIPGSLSEREALYRSSTTDMQTLVLLDNVVDLTQVRPLLPSSSSCVVIVTSRSPLAALEGATLIHLDLLKEDEALALLRTVIGHERVIAGPNAANELIELCGYLPLALRIAAARLKANSNWPIARLVDRLKDKHRRLDQLAVGDLEVRASFLVSYMSLRESDSRAFRLLGLVNSSSFSRDLAAALIQEKPSLTEDILDRLVEAQLIEADVAEDRYRFHDLLRLFAHERLRMQEPIRRQRAALQRVLRWYVSVLSEGRRRIVSFRYAGRPQGPFKTAQEAIAWFEAERTSLSQVLEQAYAMELYDDCWRVVYPADVFFDILSYWEDWEALCKLGLDAARKAQTRVGEAQTLIAFARYYDNRNRWKDALAYLQLALSIAQSERELFLESEARSGIGLALMEEGDLDTALEQFKAILASGDQFRDHATYNNVGVIYQRQGKFKEAISYFQKAMKLESDEAGPHGRAIIRVSLGLVYADQAQWSEAIDNYRFAITTFLELPDRHRAAQVLSHLGDAYAGQGSWDKSLQAYEEGLKIFRELSDPYWTARILAKLGQAHRSANDEEVARQCLQDAVKELAAYPGGDIAALRETIEGLLAVPHP